jgi:hypothetical protein
MDNTADLAGKTSIPMVDDTPGNLAPIRPRLKAGYQLAVARRIRP